MNSIREIIQEKIKIAYTVEMVHEEPHRYPKLSGIEEAIREIESNYRYGLQWLEFTDNTMPSEKEVIVLRFRENEVCFMMRFEDAREFKESLPKFQWAKIPSFG